MSKKIGLILLSVTCVVIAQLLIKKGAISLGNLTVETAIQSIPQIVLNPFIILGGLLFVTSAGLWLMVLSKAELSYAYPAMSLGYVFATIGAWLLFNESINAVRIGGLIIVCTGVFALSRT